MQVWNHDGESILHLLNNTTHDGATLHHQQGTSTWRKECVVSKNRVKHTPGFFLTVENC